ncbi:MAG: twin-arginine translocase subunit TatC [candidate division Zixibacteria bacterium]|nr:twin-arginine translocase subunit TatC [candidate division Zixibacteria bacterium]
MEQPREESKKKDVYSMSFVDHLEELRWRLFKAILSVVIAAIIAFYFSDELFQLLIIPLGDVKLHVTEVTGSFYAYLKVSLFAGIFGALPVVFYQMWMFISPGLYKQEKKVVIPLVAVSSLLFLIGAVFCYLVVLPLALKFLIGFSGDILNPIITVGSYISFTGLLLIAFGFAFELPIVAYFLGRVGLISSSFLAKGRRYAIVTILILAAIITPPDVFTQVLLAIPLYFLYEISIILVKYTGKKH